MGKFDPPSPEVQEFLEFCMRRNELSIAIGALYDEIAKYVPELHRFDYDTLLIYKPSTNRWVTLHPVLGEKDELNYEALIIGNCIKLLPECCWFNNPEDNNIAVGEISDLSWGPPYSVKCVGANKHLVLSLLEAVKFTYRQRWIDKDQLGDKCL